MAEVEIASFDRPMQGRDTSAAEGISLLADTVQDFRTANLQSRVRTTAEDIAEEANQVRFAAEGLQAAGTSADPMLDATMGREEFLAAQGDKVGAQARKSFDRYKRAVEQGASNKSAARIAVQKEMRDLISANPVYADVIRQAAAESMGEEEFLVLTRDLARPEKGQSQPETDFEKRMREARLATEAKGARNGWTAEQTEQAVANAQAYVLDTYELGLKAGLLEATENTAGLQTRFSTQAFGKVVQADANTQLEAAIASLKPGAAGLSIDPQTVNNLNLSLEQAIQRTSSELRTYLSGTAASTEQINQEIEQVVAPYREVQKIIQAQNAGPLLAGLKGALDSSAHVTMFEMLPVFSAATTVFGDNAQYALRALENNDAIANEIFINSQMFRDLNDSGINIPIEQKRQLALHNMKNSITSVLGKDRSMPLTVDERVGTGAYLGIAYNLPSAERNKDTQYRTVFTELAARGDPLTGSELARTNDPDEVQVQAAKLWKRNYEQALVSAERQGKAWVKGREDQTDYRVELQDSGTGTPVIVIRRFQLGGDPTATGEMKDVWREAPPIVQDAASESYRGLFQRYKIDRQGGQRRPVDNPKIYEALYGDTTMDVDGRIQDSLDKANIGSTGRFAE